MKVKLNDGLLLHFADEFPAKYAGLKLAGSKAAYSSNEWGNILVQEFNSKRFSIRFIIVELLSHTRLSFSYSMMKATIIYNFQHVLNIKTTTGSPVDLNAEQYGLFLGKDGMNLMINTAENYRIFETSYHDSLVENVIDSIEEQGNRIRQEATLADSSVRIKQASITIGEIVNEILTNSSAANLQTFFFENKVRELLLQILLESEKTVPAELSPVSVNALIKAKAIILSDISRHHTIGEISKRVQLNEFDLKTGFKKLWGVGIYEMLLDARMHKAKKLLLETSKPMKEIASLTGYDRLTSFIRSFRNYHNITPGSLRR